MLKQQANREISWKLLKMPSELNASMYVTQNAIALKRQYRASVTDNHWMQYKQRSHV